MLSDPEKELTQKDIDKIKKVNELKKKNDQNSSNKINNDKLPKEELKALRQSAKSVNGKEQAKIEQFLKQENIHTFSYEK